MLTHDVCFSLLLYSIPPLSVSLPLVVNCTEPGHVENSIRQVLPSGPHRYSFQTTVSYRCNPGYYLLGTSSISCQGDGTWDRSLPKCLCEYLVAWLLRVYLLYVLKERKKNCVNTHQSTSLFKTDFHKAEICCCFPIWVFMLNIIFVPNQIIANK